MRKTSIIFDHDGTLVDSIEAVVICTNLTLIKYGFPECSAEDIRAGMAFPTGDRFGVHSGCEDPALLESMSVRFYQNMHNDGIGYLKVYPGIPETLDSLAAAGYSMGMVSNNQGIFIRKAAARLKYSYDLEIILGEENIKKPKPAPDGLLQACAGLDSRPEDSWYIGDAIPDFKAARAAGMKCGLVTWGAHPEEELTGCGADKIFRTPLEMRDYFSPV